jgi:Integrase core domain
MNFARSAGVSRENTSADCADFHRLDTTEPPPDLRPSQNHFLQSA